MKILSVDDNPENLYLIEAVGRAHGFEVHSAENGLVALDRLAEETFDLIVSDVLMPEMDGFQLCHEVKCRERTQHIPFVFYTATYTAREDAELGLLLGASRYIVKPVDPDEFVAMLIEVVGETRSNGSHSTDARLKKPADYLRAYTARLVSKLDHKVEQLQRAEREREAVQAALQQSEERFRRAVLEAPIPIAIHTGDGQILQLNRAWVEQSGYSAAQLATMQDWAAQTGAGAPESGRDGDETSIRTASGKLRTWVFRSAALGAMPDGSRMMITMAMDVTERRSLERQLAQAQKMEAIGQLAGGVAHDFNNLLTVISGYSELLVQSLTDPDPACQHVREISQAAERASALTRQLLAFSRKQVLEPANVDINSIIRESQGMLRRLIGEDVEIRIVLSPEEMCALVDAGQLVQVIMNLSVNARDAMPQGGRLTIETSAARLEDDPGTYVCLAITDTGVGMDEATLAHAFEPFFTTKAPGAGTGLGLSTVYGIVKQSNGHVTVTSEPGCGTTFRVYLPRIFEPASAPEKQGAAPVHGSETVLLVEDEPALRKLAREILRLAGYKVIEAANSGEALLACERSSSEIALMITDLVMPGMSGWDLARRLTTLHPEMKVLYMSGYSHHAALPEGGIERHDEFIQKPFTPTSLQEKVRRVLDNRS